MKKLLLLLLCVPLLFSCDYNKQKMKIKKLEKNKDIEKLEQLNNNIEELEKNIDKLNNETIESEEKLEKLNTNPEKLDSFTREKFLIKKENEYNKRTRYFL